MRKNLSLLYAAINNIYDMLPNNGHEQRQILVDQQQYYGVPAEGVRNIISERTQR
jgi:hypothetical protein